MKITQKGPADTGLSQGIEKGKTIASARGESGAQAAHGNASAKVEISDKARQLQRIAELARAGDRLRAEKVRELKEQIAAGQYRVDAREVAKSILRSEVSSLMEEK